MIVTLRRWGHTPHGTFGDLTVGVSWDKAFECYTVERPWIDNERFISCIPCGTYPLRPCHYNQGDYATWEVCGVLERDEIKIHIGNTIDDLLGCIAPGTGLGWLRGRTTNLMRWAVVNSRSAHDYFMRAMDPYDEAVIIVTNRGIGSDSRHRIEVQNT